MNLSLGHDTPFLPPDTALHSRAHRLVTLFSLVCRVCRVVAPQDEEGHLGALIGDQREAVGMGQTPLESWQIMGAAFLSGHIQS